MAGIHQTLKEVRELYASLAGSAERAERVVERVEDLEKRVAGLVHKVDETAQVHENGSGRRTGRWKISWTMSRGWCTGLAERGFFSWPSCGQDSWGRRRTTWRGRSPVGWSEQS